jgi:fatty acid desaturase
MRWAGFRWRSMTRADRVVGIAGVSFSVFLVVVLSVGPGPWLPVVLVPLFGLVTYVRVRHAGRHRQADRHRR